MVYWIAIFDDQYLLRDDFDDVMLFSSTGKARTAALEKWGEEFESLIDYRRAVFYE